MRDNPQASASASAEIIAGAAAAVVDKAEAIVESIRDINARVTAFTEHITNLNETIAAEIAPAELVEGLEEASDMEAGLALAAVTVAMDDLTAAPPSQTRTKAKTTEEAWDYVKRVWSAAAHSSEIAEARLTDADKGHKLLRARADSKSQLEMLTEYLTTNAKDRDTLLPNSLDSLTQYLTGIGEFYMTESSMIYNACTPETQTTIDNEYANIRQLRSSSRAYQDVLKLKQEVSLFESLATAAERKYSEAYWQKKLIEAHKLQKTDTYELGALLERARQTSQELKEKKKELANKKSQSEAELEGLKSKINDIVKRVKKTVQNDESFQAKLKEANTYKNIASINQFILALSREVMHKVSIEESDNEEKVIKNIHDMYVNTAKTLRIKANMPSVDVFQKEMKAQLALITPDLSQSPKVRIGLAVTAAAIACAAIVLCPPVGIPLSIICGFAVASGVFGLGLLATKKLSPLLEDKRDMKGKMLAALTLAYGKDIGPETLPPLVRESRINNDVVKKAAEYMEGYKASLVRSEASLVAVLAVMKTMEKMPEAVMGLVAASARTIRQKTVEAGQNLSASAVAAGQGLSDAVTAVKAMPDTIATATSTWVDQVKVSYKTAREKQTSTK